MDNLTKEQICDKIGKLRNDLAIYQDMLNKINVQEESKFSRKVKSMVGGYYMKDLEDYRWYCRIDRVERIQDSNIDGLYARCECAFVAIPKGSERVCHASLDYTYIDEGNLDVFKSITKGEFDAAFAQFNNAFKKI